MGAWLVSIAAVVALSVLLDIIVPEGETNKYIKGIFALITIFVIISPLTLLFNNNYSFEEFFDLNNTDITIDTVFVAETQNDINDLTAEALDKALEYNGYINVTSRIYLNYDNKIDYVTVNINNLSIAENVSHINITNNITNIVSTYLNIGEEKVIVYGYYSG